MEPTRRFHLNLPSPRVTGALLCAAGLALLAAPPLLCAALGVELMATAFWWWARASDDAASQVPRWGWLRRPAAALWLATAIHVVAPGLAHPGVELHGALELARRMDAAAIVWAGLELLAALPLARTFSDLPGPLLASRGWIPVLLPVAGFVLLWRQQAHWVDVAPVRSVAAVLLLLTASLGAVRAFGRRGWTASLRWLVVCDCVLGALLIAVGAAEEPMRFLLWMGACGGHAFLLAAELRGATPRRGPALSVLWRVTTWIALTSLAWPMLVAIGFGPEGALHPLAFAAAAVPVLFASAVTVGRMVEAPERRTVMRRETGVTLSHVLPLLVLAGGPATIVAALWTGTRPEPVAAGVALLPSLVGGAVGLWGLRPAGAPAGPAARKRRVANMPALARLAFRLVVAFERRIVTVFRGLGLALIAPLRDLHSGDAQEYLLFLIGVSVLAIVLPLLH